MWLIFDGWEKGIEKHISLMMSAEKQRLFRWRASYYDEIFMSLNHQEDIIAMIKNRVSRAKTH